MILHNDKENFEIAVRNASRYFNVSTGTYANRPGNNNYYVYRVETYE